MINMKFGGDNYNVKVLGKFADIYKMYLDHMTDKDSIDNSCSLLVKFKELFYDDFEDNKVVSLKAMVDGLIY